MSAWLFVLLVPLVWAAMNGVYAWVYGRPLRCRYFWAAQGALLFGFRCERWEVR